MNIEDIFGILVGIGLAAAVGFRIFVPLFFASLASHFGWIPLNASFDWLGGNTAMIILGVATLVEIVAYLIPWLDHVLDTLAIPLAAIAGTLVMASAMTDMNPALTWALAIIAGGGTATAVQTATSSGRAVSTAATGGLANPVYAGVESFASLIMSLLSVFVPVLALVVLIIIAFPLIRRLRQRKRP